MQVTEFRQLGWSSLQAELLLVSSSPHQHQSPRKGQSFRTKTKEKLRAATDGHCEVCYHQGREVHHDTPKSRGGKGKPKNGIVVCHECHKKADELTFKKRIKLSDVLRIRRTNSPIIVRRSI